MYPSHFSMFQPRAQFKFLPYFSGCTGFFFASPCWSMLPSSSWWRHHSGTFIFSPEKGFLHEYGQGSDPYIGRLLPKKAQLNLSSPVYFMGCCSLMGSYHGSVFLGFAPIGLCKLQCPYVACVLTFSSICSICTGDTAHQYQLSQNFTGWKTVAWIGSGWISLSMQFIKFCCEPSSSTSGFAWDKPEPVLVAPWKLTGTPSLPRTATSSSGSDSNWPGAGKYLRVSRRLPGIASLSDYLNSLFHLPFLRDHLLIPWICSTDGPIDYLSSVTLSVHVPGNFPELL